MATKTACITNGCIFRWKIRNISYCGCYKLKSVIVSPVFTVDSLEGTQWYLTVYPMGEHNRDFFVLRITRVNDCGPEKIALNYQLDFVDKYGRILTEETTWNNFFKSGWGGTMCKQVPREKIYITEREAFLPEDTLTVQCRFWKREEKLIKPEFISAQTVFKVNRRSFVWKIDEFSYLVPGVRKKFKDDLIDFDVILNEEQECEKKLVIDGISVDESIQYFTFKTSIIDSEGQKKDCGRHEYFTDDLKRGVSSTLLFTKTLMENKGRYLPNDVLSLDCEYTYGTGTIVDEFSRPGHFVEPRDIKLTSALANDLKSLYSDGIFSDTELRAPTQIFPAHKAILCARSPVFRRMFSSDMKEKNSGFVDITDLEDDTVHRMLLYMYTDSLEDLHLDGCMKLYAAAEKYQILSLKSRCSSFLTDNLITTKACDILVLADLHQDDDLKRAVQDFILGCDKEVFGSEQWKHLMASNLQLASDVMYRKYSV